MTRRIRQSCGASADTPAEFFIDRARQGAIAAERDGRSSSHFREVVLLCDVEEMSYKEISEALSIPAGTVMSRLSRARKSLRQILQQ